jgi:uncharacterized protein (DUF488 family)
MYYRRKIIFALLEQFEGELDKIRLQKLLFLFTQRQKKVKAYDFVPYKYGCYSFSANADLTAMVRRGMLTESETTFAKSDDINYYCQLNKDDAKLLIETVERYGKMNANALLKHTYINFPYWSINSTVAQDILDEAQYKKVRESKPKVNKQVLYTIGYEGISLEEYINRLLKNDVKLLVDVRNNPKSMKYGFSKATLQKVCEGVGIDYIHKPQVGIVADKRKELQTQKDYDVLFKDYKLTNLANTIDVQKDILQLLRTNERIALTCFEANICQCHRKPLAESIASLSGFNGDLQHI